ncbi:MAG: NAD(P)/FAD-dependent oxidoreductase [Pseudomonadales bacterium]|nr:MAG: NAD(P)/FAD-dependent oxidoreductase [Pseudomonadales bacterium]
MNKAGNQFDALIIGGGHNGLVCAWYLARKGKRVGVLERASTVGGAAITEEFYPGFRNSVASYTVSLLQPKVIADMGLAKHGLEVVLRKVDNFLPTKDGYLLSGRDGLTVREIERHSARDAQSYPRYSAALDNVVDCIKQFLLVAPPNVGGGFADLLALLKAGRVAQRLSLETQRDLLDFFTKSASEILDSYFENDTVKALFAFDATVGHFASPHEPGSAYVLLHHVFGEAAGVAGAWGHAIGGMGAITQAMLRACETAGVTVLTDASVEQILTENNKVTGARSNGTTFLAPVVASSVHPQVLFQQLLEDEQLEPDFRRRIDNYKSHSGTFRMNVALDRLPKFINSPLNTLEGADHLTGGIIIAPDMQYMHNAWVSATQSGWSDKPIIEMLIPSTLDDSLAPAGKHVASLFCQQFAYSVFFFVAFCL